MKKYVFPVLFFLFLSAVLFPQKVCHAQEDFLNQYVQTLYNDENLLPGGEANSVLQTEEGYIWIGGYAGLSVYNGQEMQEISDFPVLNQEAEIQKPGITCMLQDTKGRLWLGTNTDGLLLRQEKGYVLFDQANGLGSASIRTITEDEKNARILVGTAEGFYYLEEEKDGEFSCHSTELALDYVLSAACDEEGNVYVVTNDGTVFAGDAAGHLEEIPSGVFGGKTPSCVSIGKTYGLVFGTVENMVFFGEDGEDFVSLELSNMISMLEDSEGRLFVCADTGIGYFDGKESFSLLKNMKISNSFEEIFEDYEGNFWIASSRQGVLKLGRSKIGNFGQTAGLPEMTVNTICCFEGLLYFGSDSGLYAVDENYDIVENELTDYLKGDRIRHMMKDSEGNLWICDYTEKGLVKYTKEHTWVTYGIKEGMPSMKVRCVLESRDHSIYVGTADGLARIRNGKIDKVFTQADGLMNMMILCLYEDAEGNIYAGSDGSGLYLIKDDKVSVRNTKNGLTSDIVLRLKGFSDGSGVWICNSNSLCYEKDHSIYCVEGSQELGSLYDILFDEENRMWILSSEGVMIADEQKLLSGDLSHIRVMNKSEGLASAVTANSWNFLDQDQKMYVCGTRGPSVLNTAGFYENKTAPKIAVDHILVDDKEYPEEPVLKLGSDVQRVTIRFSMLSFVPTDKGEIFYYLEGFDKEVQSISMDKPQEASYTNLDGGIYRFHVYAVNGDGTMSASEKTIEVQKEYGLLERTYIRVLIGIAILAVVLFLAMLFLYYRIRTYKKRQEEYKAVTIQTITAIVNIIEAKDPYTRGHSTRVAIYSSEMARRLHYSPEEVEHINYLALLHDVGKVGIPDEILLKKSGLTREEFDIMKTHTTIGSDILASITTVKDIQSGARYHHERFGGKGYPEGISGEAIPSEARLICVADSYDAMSSDRAYRKALPAEVIIEELEKGKGTQFDPVFADVMLGMIRDGFCEKIREEFHSAG